MLLFEGKNQRGQIKDFFEDFQLAFQARGISNITPKFGGKASGIQKYLDQHGIQKEETMAFGDGENDIEMLQFAGIGVAMGNADKRVKEQADYVTSTVDEGGIEQALRYFGLIQ